LFCTFFLHCESIVIPHSFNFSGQILYLVALPLNLVSLLINNHDQQPKSDSGKQP